VAILLPTIINSIFTTAVQAIMDRFTEARYWQSCSVACQSRRCPDASDFSGFAMMASGWLWAFSPPCPEALRKGYCTDLRVRWIPVSFAEQPEWALTERAMEIHTMALRFAGNVGIVSFQPETLLCSGERYAKQKVPHRTGDSEP